MVPLLSKTVRYVLSKMVGIVYILFPSKSKQTQNWTEYQKASSKSSTKNIRLPLLFGNMTLQNQGRHVLFLSGKAATVVTTSAAVCRHCHCRFLFCKIQPRPRPWGPCQLWRPSVMTKLTLFSIYFVKINLILGL